METTLLPLNQAPMDGTPIYIRTWDSYRYQPYSPKSQEYKRGRAGRWQTSGEYGGWENCQAPKGALWSADHTVFDAVDTRLATALSVQKQLVEALEASEFILSMIVQHGQYKPLDVSAVKELHDSARAAILAAKASS